MHCSERIPLDEAREGFVQRIMQEECFQAPSFCGYVTRIVLKMVVRVYASVCTNATSMQTT